MMGFFMHFWKKVSRFIGLVVIFSCAATSVHAAGIQVKSAELIDAGEGYQLNADFNIDFSAEVEEALSKGVPLNFVVEFKLVSPRRFWFDQEVVTATQRLRLSFHALSRQYLINLPQHQKSFGSLPEALETLSRVHDWIVLEKSQVGKDEEYRAELKFWLDSERLPKALQVESLSSEKWSLAAKPYRWTPNFKFE
jgi:hypothetical protein